MSTTQDKNRKFYMYGNRKLKITMEVLVELGLLEKVPGQGGQPAYRLTPKGKAALDRRQQ